MHEVAREEKDPPDWMIAIGWVFGIALVAGLLYGIGYVSAEVLRDPLEQGESQLRQYHP